MFPLVLCFPKLENHKSYKPSSSFWLPFAANVCSIFKVWFDVRLTFWGKIPSAFSEEEISVKSMYVQ